MSYFSTPKVEVTRPADDDEAAALKGDVTPGETKDCGAPDGPGVELAGRKTPTRRPSLPTMDTSDAINATISEMRKLTMDKYGRNLTIDPLKNQYAQWWDAVICVALVYTALVPPAEVAFSKGDDAVRVDALFCINQVINFVFFVDMILQFFLHVQLPKAQGSIWIRGHRKIVLRYVRGAFFLDFISIIPFGALSFTDIAIFQELQVVRLLRLLRLVKLLRMLRGSRLIMRYRASMTLSITGANLIGFLVVTILASHWLACLWGYAGNLIGGKENSWMATFLRDDDDDNYDGGGRRRNHVTWDIEDTKIQYLLCLYFTLTTLTTVGYGDVHAHNVAERAVVSVMMLYGGLMWAWIIGAVTQAVTTLDVKKIQYNQTYDQINWMLLDLGVVVHGHARAEPAPAQRARRLAGRPRGVGLGVLVRERERVGPAGDALEGALARRGP